MWKHYILSDSFREIESAFPVLCPCLSSKDALVCGDDSQECWADRRVCREKSALLILHTQIRCFQSHLSTEAQEQN